MEGGHWEDENQYAVWATEAEDHQCRSPILETDPGERRALVEEKGSNVIGKPVALIQLPNQRLFTLTAAARFLDKHKNTIRKLADLGKLEAKIELDLSGHKRRVFTLEAVDKDDHPDWDARLKAADIGLSVQGAYPKKQASVQPLQRDENNPMQVIWTAEHGRKS